MLFFIHFNSGYCLILLAIQVLSDALGYLGTVWCSWLSGYCLTLLAIWVLSDALDYLGPVWCSWLSTFHFLPELIFVKCYSLFILILATAWSSWLSRYCLMLLAIWVLSDALGYLGTVWRSWLSGYCLMLLAIWVLSDTLDYLGPVWCSWLSTYHFLPELIFVKCYSLFILVLAIWVLFDAPWLSGCCLMHLAIRVLSDTLGYLGTV